VENHNDRAKNHCASCALQSYCSFMYSSDLVLTVTLFSIVLNLLLMQTQNINKLGTADGGTVVKVLRYKSGGRQSDSRWCHWNFSLT
jgi:hypothetical protein